MSSYEMSLRIMPSKENAVGSDIIPLSDNIEISFSFVIFNVFTLIVKGGILLFASAIDSVSFSPNRLIHLLISHFGCDVLREISAS